MNGFPGRHLYSGVELNKVSYSKTQDNDLIDPTSALYMLSCIVILFPGDTYGDACIEDFDGDGVHDKEDACPVNPRITRTDFSLYHTLAIDPESTKQERPIWKVNKKVI